MNAADYLATEVLRDGRPARVRALKSTDRASMLAAVGRIGADNLYRRFFGAKQHFSESEIAYYVDVDFVDHVALVVELDENGAPLIAGGGRYVVTQPGSAEMAFAVDDSHHGLGIGSLLMRHLAAIAGATGLQALHAEVLADNAPMLAVFKRSGLPLTLTREAGVTLVRMDCRPGQAMQTPAGEGGMDEPRKI